MTGRVIDRETAGFLILLIPLAIAAVVLLTAWPYILALLGLIIAWRLWQNYQWLKWCEQVNPFFNQLIKENQGCLTAMDLSLKANLAGGTAKRFLERKAEEYGAQKQIIQDKGTIYYFLTASALGSIFDDSEPLRDLEAEMRAPKLPESSPPLSMPKHKPAETSVPNIAQLVDLEETTVKFEEETNREFIEEKSENTSLTVDSVQEQVEDSVNKSNQGLELIQADLAKRLETTPSTIGRRKTEPDFAEWSQSKDPEGIAWRYVSKNKTFVPIDEGEL